MYFSGDLHNLLDKYMQYIDDKGIVNDVIINQGDTNIGIYDNLAKWKEMDKFFEQRGVHFYACRGNHDDARFFMGKYLNGYFTNIHLVPDFTVLNLNGKNVLFIGGAISVDRVKRKQIELNNENLAGMPISYYENEGVIFNEKHRKFISEIRNIDIMVTHTAPNWCFPVVNIGDVKGDPNLGKEITEERDLMSEIFGILLQNNNIQYHFYGHFHNFYNTEYKGIQHYCLDEIDFKFIYD